MVKISFPETSADLEQSFLWQRVDSYARFPRSKILLPILHWSKNSLYYLIFQCKKLPERKLYQGFSRRTRALFHHRCSSISFLWDQYAAIRLCAAAVCITVFARGSTYVQCVQAFCARNCYHNAVFMSWCLSKYRLY